MRRIHRIAAPRKFSKFHSSQQCDERKAVESSVGIIAKFLRPQRGTCLYPLAIRQTRVSFRENGKTRRLQIFQQIVRTPYSEMFPSDVTTEKSLVGAVATIELLNSAA